MGKVSIFYKNNAIFYNILYIMILYVIMFFERRKRGAERLPDMLFKLMNRIWLFCIYGIS